MRQPDAQIAGNFFKRQAQAFTGRLKIGTCPYRFRGRRCRRHG
jgi:hypothetical protein